MGSYSHYKVKMIDFGDYIFDAFSWLTPINYQYFPLAKWKNARVSIMFPALVDTLILIERFWVCISSFEDIYSVKIGSYQNKIIFAYNCIPPIFLAATNINGCTFLKFASLKHLIFYSNNRVKTENNPWTKSSNKELTFRKYTDIQSSYSA